jgi:hypothetical protein
MSKIPKTPAGHALTAVFASTAEWLFAMLPLVVVSIVMAHLGKVNNLIESQEWAFGAAILSAQALVRFVGGVARARKISLERVLLGIALILVGVVGPANVVLVLVLVGELRDHQVSRGLGLAQVFLFGAASILFVMLAAAGHLWSGLPERRVEDDQQTDL